MTRQEANLKILDRIKRELETNPNLRFNQCLVNMLVSESKVVDVDEGLTEYREDCLDYYEESKVTLQRMR